MTTSTVPALTRNFDALGVDWSRTTADGFAEVIAEVITPPAVGISLPFSGVSLPETLITLQPTAGDLETARTGVTAAACAVASYGSLVIQSRGDWTEPVSLFPGHHVAVLRKSDIVPDMEAAFRWMDEVLTTSRSSLVLATGPSATADMGALVRGAHGPESVHVIILDDL